MKRYFLLAALAACCFASPSQAADKCRYSSGVVAAIAGQDTDLQCDAVGRLIISTTSVAAQIGIDQAIPGTSNGVQVNAALPAGTNIIGKVGIDQTTPGTTNGVQITATTAVAPVVSAAAESDHVLKGSAGSLISVSTTAGASAGYMLIFDATAAPVDGAVTPKVCIPVVANGSADRAWQTPLSFATGITVSFSTTGCFSKTASATAFFSAQVR